MKFLILLFYILPSFSQSFGFQDQQKEFLKDVKKNVPHKIYKKIKKIEFKKAVPSYFSLMEDTENISMKVKIATDELICNGANVTSVEVEGMWQFKEALRSSLIKNANKYPCNPRAKEQVNLEELNTIFKKLKKRSVYNNDHPNGVCFSRTYLISRELDKLGIKSKQLFVEGWILASYQKEKYFGVEAYDLHKANIVSVSTPQGPVDYVIDPMFTDNPMPLDDFKKMITTPKIENHYQILKQDHFGYPSDEIKDIKSTECYYNEFILEEEYEAVKAPALSEYSMRHAALLKDKYLSRKEALDKLKYRSESQN